MQPCSEKVNKMMDNIDSEDIYSYFNKVSTYIVCIVCVYVCVYILCMCVYVCCKYCK